MAVNAEDQNAGKGNRCRKLYSEHKVIVLSTCLIVIGVIVGILLILAIPVLLKKVERPYRLPTDLLPYHYELEVKPHLTPNDFIFEGKVAIHVICSKKTDSIILHARNLTIKEKSIKVTSIDSGEDYEVWLVDYDTTNDLLILRLLEELKEWTRYRIYIDYTGILTKKATGFYVSSYEDDQNVTHYVASTDFEPVNARRAFPCFDEPQLKSKFNITLVRWDNMTTLSNMPKLRTENRGRYWKADVYKESMKMSTYLVAFVFCDYVGNTKGKVTVWSPEHRRKDTDLALEVAIKAIEFLEEKLKIPYPGAKLDMVPVPYPQASAMENWGLIIYPENFLLTPEEKGEEGHMANTRITITGLVSHEIAHHWFGNLVTLKWWSDAWLNEGITSYMGHLITAAILPDWNQVDPTVKKVFNEFRYYCFNNKPLRRPVHNSEEASDIFDSVTYGKGAMITRMAHYILGEEVFWKGIRRYLNTFSHENAEESDFWKHLTAAQLHKPRLDMEELMRPWTHLGSAPIVTAHRDYSTRKVIISQQPCNHDNKENENDIWNIPLVFGTKFHSNISGKIMWLTKRNTTVEDMPEEKHWIVINANATGYYLVNYDRKNWELLCKQLLQSHTIFQPTERYKLILDITMLDGMGYVDIDLVFQCLLYTPQENEVVIQQHQIPYLHNYMNYFDEENDFELMEEFTVHMSKRIYDKYGWDGRRNSTKMLSVDELSIGALTTRLLCYLGYGPCVQEAFNHYEEIRNPEKKWSFFEYIWIILCTVSGNATLEEWDSIKDQYSDKIFENLSLALCTKDASIIRQELRNSYEGDEEVDLLDLLFEPAFTKIAFDECLNFVDVNFHKIPATKIKLYKHVKESLKRFGNLSRMKRIVSLLERHRRNASGSKAKNIGKVLEFFEETMPSWQKRARQLRSWLQKKLWRNG